MEMEKNKLEKNKYYINIKYFPNLKANYPIYKNMNGIIKGCANFSLLKRLINNKDFFYDLSDFPEETQEEFFDKAITEEDLRVHKKENPNYIYDENKVHIYVNDNTKILPIVGNFLPNDGINGYSIVLENGKRKLKSILICINYHWSDLFRGDSPYGQNVFCLASDLSDEQRELFKDDIITIGEVPIDIITNNKKIK